MPIRSGATIDTHNSPAYSDFNNLFFSSNTSSLEVDKVEDNLKHQSFENLKKNIGEKLYNKLSFEQKKFIVEVGGSIYLEDDVNLSLLDKELEKID